MKSKYFILSVLCVCVLCTLGCTVTQEPDAFDDNNYVCEWENDQKVKRLDTIYLKLHDNASCIDGIINNGGWHLISNQYFIPFDYYDNVPSDEIIYSTPLFKWEECRFVPENEIILSDDGDVDKLIRYFRLERYVQNINKDGITVIELHSLSYRYIDYLCKQMTASKYCQIAEQNFMSLCPRDSL